MKIMPSTVLLLTMIALAGCQSAYRNHAKQVATSYRNGDYQTASAAAQADGNERR